MEDRLEIKTNVDCKGKYYTVNNLAGGYLNHSHFRKKSKAECLVRLMNRYEIPDNPYFRESAARVTIVKDYKEKLINGR